MVQLFNNYFLLIKMHIYSISNSQNFKMGKCLHAYFIWQLIKLLQLTIALCFFYYKFYEILNFTANYIN